MSFETNRSRFGSSATEVNNHSVDVRMSLGVNTVGEQAGYLVLHEETPSSALYSPASLKLFSRQAGEVIESGGAIRQIRIAQGLVDVVAFANGFDATFHSAVGEVVGGLYTPAGVTNAALRFEDPDGSTNKLKITETVAGVSKVYLYEWVPANNDWTLWWPDLLGKAVRSTDSLPSSRTEELVLESTNGVAAFKESKTWTIDYLLGDLLTSHTIGEGSDSRTTTYAWYTDYMDSHNYKKLKQMEQTGGAWEKYSYTNGRISKVVSCFGDNSLTSAESINRVTTYSYAPVDALDDGTISTNTPRLVIEKLANQEIRRMYRVIAPGLMIEAVCTTPGASVWSENNLFTTNIITFDTSFDGTIESVTYPDGSMQISQVQSDLGSHLDI